MNVMRDVLYVSLMLYMVCIYSVTSVYRFCLLEKKEFGFSV